MSIRLMELRANVYQMIHSESVTHNIRYSLSVMTAGTAVHLPASVLPRVAPGTNTTAHCTSNTTRQGPHGMITRPTSPHSRSRTA